MVDMGDDGDIAQIHIAQIPLHHVRFARIVKTL
jgi:hypothetical protein